MYLNYNSNIAYDDQFLNYNGGISISTIGIGISTAVGAPLLSVASQSNDSNSTIIGLISIDNTPTANVSFSLIENSPIASVSIEYI